MVNFSVFNELSLPINEHHAQEDFGVFFGLLSELKKKGLVKIRMSEDFKNYSILENVTFSQFLGQQTNHDFKSRLRSFISNTIVKIETPLIKDEEDECDQLGNCEYFYNDSSTDGGLACCDIWNTLTVSFDSDTQWDKSGITLQKHTIVEDNIAINNIVINHASKPCHLDQHQDFFQRIGEEKKLSITPDNFWNNREENFPKIIKFCPEVEAQIQKLDKIIFQQAISILRDVETQLKNITDFSHSSEAQTVQNNPTLKNQRLFTINNEKVFFQNHIKSLPSNYRIYFLEKDGVIYIGYIGKHLKTKRDN